MALRLSFDSISKTMPNITYDFKGKVVIITGAGSGIGETTAYLFAKAGADVVIVDINGRLPEVATKCEEISHNKSRALQVIADVTNEIDLIRLVKKTLKEFGKIDILVNNAGIVRMKEITDPDYMKAFKEVMQTNLNSAVFLTHRCVEHLAKTKGNVINTSSIASSIYVSKTLNSTCSV